MEGGGDHWTVLAERESLDEYDALRAEWVLLLIYLQPVDASVRLDCKGAAACLRPFLACLHALLTWLSIVRGRIGRLISFCLLCSCVCFCLTTAARPPLALAVTAPAGAPRFPDPIVPVGCHHGQCSCPPLWMAWCPGPPSLFLQPVRPRVCLDS